MLRVDNKFSLALGYSKESKYATIERYYAEKKG